jgi:hypothetical protein
MSQKEHRFIALAPVWLALTLAWSDAQADTVRERIEACAANRDDAARLRCFDELAKTMRTETPDEKTSEPAADTRGVHRAPAPRVTQTARIVSVSQPDGRKYRIVLDNDQVWQESEHTRDLDLAAGQTVRIKPGVLGSFFLMLDSGLSTRVRRIR